MNRHVVLIQNFVQGKIDQERIPASSIFLMKLLGFQEKLTKPNL